MKFAHIADCHVGGWRDECMRVLGEESFVWTIKKCIEESVDFVLCCGDLLNTAIPPVESLKIVFESLKLLKDKNIPFYFIAGSHDCSSSGKSFLEVIESAGLGVNVMRGSFVESGKLALNPVKDVKTGVSLVGISGRRAGLESELFELLERPALETISGSKIFLFHTTIAELKPKGLEKVSGVPLSLFPKQFQYYAGGHVHTRHSSGFDSWNIVYPGPLFPNSFSELEDLKHGSFVIVDDWVPRIVVVPSRKVVSILVDVSGLLPLEVSEKISRSDVIVDGAIVLLRIHGRLKQGRASQVDMQIILSFFENRGAFHVLRNTSGLEGEEISEVRVPTGSAEDIEERIVVETVKNTIHHEGSIARNLLKSLILERGEGETVTTFEKRVENEVDNVLKEVVK